MSTGMRQEKLNDRWLDPNGNGCYFRNLGFFDKLQILNYYIDQPRMISMNEYITKYSSLLNYQQDLFWFELLKINPYNFIALRSKA